MTWRARRVDANQAALVAVARKMGCSVLDTSRLGQGAPDLVIGMAGKHGRVNLLVEVKDSAKPPSARRLTADEREFRDGWRGQYAVIESVGQLLALLRA